MIGDKRVGGFYPSLPRPGRWLILLIFMIPLILTAQNYPVRHFTLSDGLPDMAIRCIYKDSRGLIWIGTDAGLCTFDGRIFITFKPSEGMTANQIWAIAEDEQGNMWFGSFGEGLYKYDGKHFERFTRKNGLADDRIRALCYSPTLHCLVAGGYDGITTITGGKFKSSVGDKALGKIYFGCVTSLTDAGNFIYITTYNHFSPIRYYPDQNKYISLHDSGVYYPSHSFSSFLTAKGDTVFSLTKNGVWIYKEHGIIKNDTLGQIFGITENKRGDLWLASWSVPGMNFKGGVIKYDGQTFRNYKDNFGITDREIWTVYCDKEQDILWVGTLNEGLFMVPSSAIKIFPVSQFNPGMGKINDLYMASNDELWISGNRELIRMTPDNHFIPVDKHQMILSFRKRWKIWNPKFDNRANPVWLEIRKAESGLLPELEKHTEFDFTKVIEETSHSILFNCRLGVFSYHEKTGKPTFIGINTGISEMALQGNDTLVFAGWGATSLHPKFRVALKPLDTSSDYPPIVVFPNSGKNEPKDVNCLVKHENRLWYTSWASGLWMSEGLKLIHFNKSDTTISSNLKSICFDQMNHVIFGSNTGEICIATYEHNKLKIDYRINSDKGLQGSSIYWLLADRSGKLWAGTNRGLNCIDLNQLYRNNKYSIRFLDEEDGYLGPYAKKGVMDSKGIMWLASADQLIRLDTKKFLASEFNAGKIILKSTLINNTYTDTIPKTTLNAPIHSFSVKSTLRHSENNLTFNYDVLNYNNPFKDRFRYILNGYDKSWTPWMTGRKAVYTNLPPGKYTLRVESTNLATMGQAESLNTEFTINRPWWERWYLQIPVLLFIGILTIWVIRRLMEAEKLKQLKKSAVEVKLAQLEMQALQAQMNPHFIFNTINGIQYFVLANKMDTVLSLLSDFSKVVRESLRNATQRMIPLEQEIDFLHSYLRLEQMRFPDKFVYTIQCSNGEDSGNVQIPPMVVQPYVENSIRHGFMHLKSTGHLSIVFEIEREEILLVTISDNGIGREKAGIQNGPNPKNDRPHSTKITEARIRLFNSTEAPEMYKVIYTDLSENDLSSGFKVELFLPIWEENK